MKQFVFPAIKLTLLCLVFFSGIYTLMVYGVARLAPGKGEGETILVKGRKYYSNIGQQFTDDKYFYGRPSAVAYNAAGAAGSNKGPSNPDYLAQVQARIDTFLNHNPGVQKHQIPSDLVTASGSGLDPHISVQAARVQAERIARLRQLPVAEVEQLIEENTERPLAGLFGTSRINVLLLNLSLDEHKKQDK